MPHQTRKPMPKSYPTSSIGIPLVFTGPATIEEYQAVAGADILADAVGGVIAWDTLPEWQSQFAPIVEKLTDVKRAVNTSATAAAKAASESPDKIKDILETVPKYVKRVLAGLSDDGKKALIKAGQDLAATMTIDVGPSRRTGKPKAEYLAKADTWLAMDMDAREAKITKSQDLVGGNYPIDRDDGGVPERESLARFIGAVIDAMAKAV